ncbi:MAG: M16 family metallopeptidase [Sulfurospirillum sp.]
MKKTFRTRTLNGTKFNFIALPDSKYFKFSITNSMGSNIERLYQEKVGKNVYGISHFVEHLAFKSTRDFTTEELTQLGKVKGNNNAGTTYDYIDYFFETSSSNSDLAIQIVCNTAFNDLSKLSQEEFDTEKMVILNEVKRYMDDDQMMFAYNCAQVACEYEEGDNILGLPEIIESFTLEDVRAIKNIFLHNEHLICNVIYDPLAMSEEELLEKITQEMLRFAPQEKSCLSIDTKAYKNCLKFPKQGHFKLENEAEQALTTLMFEANINAGLSDIVRAYFETFAEDTSLDDIIRQKNGLTYGIESYIETLSDKPYIFFSCDVSLGDEQKLMDFFSQSIHLSMDNFTPQKHQAFIEALVLKRIISNINMSNYESLFIMDRIDPSVWEPFYSILEQDIDEAFKTIYGTVANYDTMKTAMQEFVEAFDAGKYTKITNV